jgi:hypothetical protein
MKNLKFSLAYILFTLFLISCGGSSNSENSSSTDSEVSSDLEENEDPCDDMRSYDSGIEYGTNDVRGARVAEIPVSSCEEVLKYYDDNYDQNCFCLGFYKGQSEG